MSPIAPPTKTPAKVSDAKTVVKPDPTSIPVPTPKRADQVSATPANPEPENADATKVPGKKVVLTLTFAEDLAEDIRFVSYVRGVSLSDYVSSKITPTIDADVQAVLAARARKGR